MRNQELSKIFFQIADYLEIDGVSFKPYAYRKVAMVLENLKDDVGEIYRNGVLIWKKKYFLLHQCLSLEMEVRRL